MSAKFLKKREVAKLVTENSQPCVFCSQDVDDEVIFGKLYSYGDIQCHYFCVLLSCCLVQKGRDSEGLFGFLYKDILAEVERSKKHKCSYCGRGGASLGCSVASCRKQFHLPCGRRKNAISLYYGNYKSFCELHAPKQKISNDVMTKAKERMKVEKLRKAGKLPVSNGSQQTEDPSMVCVICYEEVQAYPTTQTFWPPCCGRDAWLHRTCLQRMALSAGMHYLKCPLCNDKENFYDAVCEQGYYLPDRDAAWELEQNAFAEIYNRDAECAATECKCPFGRSHDELGMWDIKLCLLCGSWGMHSLCSGGERPLCASCRPAATDIDQLETRLTEVILAEQALEQRRLRSGPVMPARMSLRRTKGRVQAHSASSSSQNLPTPENMPKKTECQTPTDRLELNLKTPRRAKPTPLLESKLLSPIRSQLRDLEHMLSPIKRFEQSYLEKGGEVVVSSEVIEKIRLKFTRPKPLSAKKKIVNEILNDLLKNMFKENPKSKDPVRVWNSPKKSCDALEQRRLRSGPVMPARMSLRRTKGRVQAHSASSSSQNLPTPENMPKKTECQTPTDRLELNLKTPRRAKPTPLLESKLLSPIRSQLRDLEHMLSPIKRFEQSYLEKGGEVVVSSEVIEKIRLKFTRPKPLSAKKKIVNEILNDLLKNMFKENPKSKDPVRVWNSPKKSCDALKPILEEIAETKETEVDENNSETSVKAEETDANQLENHRDDLSKDESIDVNTSDKENDINHNNERDTNDYTDAKSDDESSCSTFVLPSEFVAENHDDDSLPIIDTPKKLKMIDIKQESIEISKKNETVNIDVVQIGSGKEQEFVKSLSLMSPVTNKIFSFKFSPLDKPLKTDVDMDIESFKDQYLNEVDRDKSNINHFKTDDQLNLTVCKKRKLEMKGNGSKRRRKDKESKIQKEKDMKRKKIKLKIKAIHPEKNREKRRFKTTRKMKELNKKLVRDKNMGIKIKLKDASNKIKKAKKIQKTKSYKQYVLKYSPLQDSKVIAKPEVDVTPMKRKYTKSEKSPADNLVQTSIQSFFFKANQG